MEELTNKYFITSYLEEVSKRSMGSFNNNKHIIRDLTNHIKKPVQEITMIDIQVYFINIIDKKEIKKSTKNTIRYALKAFFNYIQRILLSYNINYANPVLSKKVFQFSTNLEDIGYVVDSTLQILTIEQIKKILNYCKKNRPLRDFILAALTIFCGSRISEIRTIRTKDINIKECYFQTGFISGARKTTLHTNMGLLFFFPKVFLPYLQLYINSCQKCEKWLFPGYNKNPLSRSTVQDIISHIRTDLGFHFTWHYFRKTRITEMTKMGCSLEIREMLHNHAPSSVEGKSYIKLSIKEKQNLYNKWDPYKKIWGKLDEF